MMTKDQTDRFYHALEMKLDANKAKLIEDQYMILRDGDMCVEFKGYSFKAKYSVDSEEYLAVVYAAEQVNIPLSKFGL